MPRALWSPAAPGRSAARCSNAPRRRGGTCALPTWQRPVELATASEVEVVHADVRDAEAMASAMRGVDAVIHTAYRQGEAEWSTNVLGSEVVARAARGRRLVHLSTDLVFDGTKGRYRETDAAVAGQRRTAARKLEAERRVGHESRSATIVRTSLIYGVPDGPQERLAREGKVLRRRASLARPRRGSRRRTARVAGSRRRRPAPSRGRGRRQSLRVRSAARSRTSDASNARRRRPTERPNVTLDSSRAQSLLSTRLRGVYEVLEGSSVARLVR